MKFVSVAIKNTAPNSRLSMRLMKKIFRRMRRSHHPRNHNSSVRILPRLLLVLLAGNIAPSLAQTKPQQDYLFYVLSEAADRISLIRFGPKAAHVERDLQTGDMPIDIDGPHGLAIAPDKKVSYVSLAHGRPF